MYIENFAKLIFKNIDISFPQNIETQNYLNKLKVRNIKVTGNLNFRKSDHNINKINSALKLQLSKKKSGSIKYT